MRILAWATVVTVAVWILAEIGLQVRQYRQRGTTKQAEWGSFGVIVLCVVLGELLAKLAAEHLSALTIPLGKTTLFAIALPIAWAGIIFRLWAIRSLGRFFRGIVHVQADHHVVETGPYRVLRHPSYTGLLVGLLGLSVIDGNVAAIVAFVGCVFAGLYYRIRVEERVLCEQLGQDYRDYMTRTARLVPGVW